MQSSESEKPSTRRLARYMNTNRLITVRFVLAVRCGMGVIPCAVRWDVGCGAVRCGDVR